MKPEGSNRIMYEVRRPGTASLFTVEVLKFTDDLSVAKKYPGEIWKITYMGDSWKRWKEERLSEYVQQSTLF